MRLKPRQFRKPNLGHPLAKGLVGCWLMNEGGGNTVADLSGNGNTGTFVATAQFTPGDRGPGVLLDGDSDYIEFGDPAVLELGGDVTYVVRFKPNSVTGVRAIMGKIEFSDATEKDIGISLYDDTIWWQLGSEDPSFARLKSTTNAVIGQWYTAVGTRKGTACKLYVDAALEDSDTCTGDINPAHNFRIGAHKTGTAYFFSGVVGYTMVYNRALSASEIAELYANPFGMFQRDSIELWTGAMGGEAPTGNAGIMTAWGGYWGATY